MSRIGPVLEEREAWKTAGSFEQLAKTIAGLPPTVPSRLALDQDVVQIGASTDLSQTGHRQLREVLQSLIPWKKGPFSIFGHDIDAEWRSHLKWQRLLPKLGSLTDQVIADIGCNNGYFMLRMAADNPRLVLGFEPFAKHWHCFSLLQKFAAQPHLKLELLGVEHVDMFPKCFDKVFCLGILYHHTDPMSILRKIHRSLKSKGRIIIDCVTMPGDEPVSLTPRRRYAGMKGVWFVPTVNTLCAWLRRAMFDKIEVVFDDWLDLDEQRRTEWAPIDSLPEFLDANDRYRTIEGYPAPRRTYLIASKP